VYGEKEVCNMAKLVVGDYLKFKFIFVTCGRATIGLVSQGGNEQHKSGKVQQCKKVLNSVILYLDLLL
jgi:hypothetical protein